MPDEDQRGHGAQRRRPCGCGVRREGCGGRRAAGECAL
ncbi:hypothetical protein SNL152K_8081 [Streptomyces sp. NL15-2K]|nr:hypothetical protein SNL152K_8081 [Streptomyces sp. NL15-2K]